MLPLLALLVAPATAGDQALYERALQLVDHHYLRAEGLSRETMLAEAGDQLEAKVEWLLADTAPGVVTLRDGGGAWQETVRLAGPTDLPAALARLEDAVRAAGRPIDPEVDLRVEILRGVAKTLDRHSVVLHADGLERFDEKLSGTLSGVGATISFDDDGLFVRDLVAEGPAARAGLHTGDRIVSIDGVSTVGMVPGDATERIRGRAGTSVTLGLRRGGEPLTLAIRREEITVRNVEASRGPHDVGVITIRYFSEQTRGYLAEAIAELRADGLLDNGIVIDLRGNTGGSLIQSARAADAFLHAGLVVATTGRNGTPVPGLVPRIDAEPDDLPADIPIAVLMDHSTASGSEILAGALGTLDRAILVGTTSFGKGTVQKIYELAPSIKLKLTVAEYLLDGGYRVADGGLVPDVALEEVRFDTAGAWFPSPAQERRRHRPGTPTLRHLGGDDRALEVAAAVVAASGDGTRTAALDALRTLQTDLSAEEDARLTLAFKDRGIDWSPAPAPVVGDPMVEVRWSWSTPPAAGAVTTLSATVTNRGPTLHRAALRLASVNPTWDDLVLPLGKLERGQSRVGTVKITLGEGIPTRTDRLDVALEADGIAPRPLLAHDVTTLGEALPPVAVTARASQPSDDGVVRVFVEVDNRGEQLLSGVSARLAFPDVDGIELVDARTPATSVVGRGSIRSELRLRVAPTWEGAAYPLSLTVSDDRGLRLADWKLSLPRGGAPVRLEPPTLVIEPPPTVVQESTARLRVRASDDRALDHVVVYAGVETMNRARATPAVEHARDKVAWRAGGGRRVDLDLEVPVLPGTNRYIVVAED
ncbi:MAG: S41 family peptidase, partial [Myxococcota bacterium]